VVGERLLFYTQIYADSRRFLKPFYPLITRMTRIFADYFWIIVVDDGAFVKQHQKKSKKNLRASA
jgi:hypothetical protein